MALGFNIKTKSALGFGTRKVKNASGKLVSEMITTSIKQNVSVIAGAAITESRNESVRIHNERVLMQAAMFFQRVVTRTPKDEEYFNPSNHERNHMHIPDDDYVWKNWTAKYWRRSITAEQMGEDLFDDESKFNSKQAINQIANIMIENLFGGKEKFETRKTKIRGIRFENTHPRFAQLEYGGYEGVTELPPAEGPKHWHGIKNGFSVQAPYGMLRITETEMKSMTAEDFDAWISDRKRKSRKKDIYNAMRVPSKTDVKKLASMIGDRTHLSESDIDAVARIFEKNKGKGGGEE